MTINRIVAGAAITLALTVCWRSGDAGVAAHPLPVVLRTFADPSGRLRTVSTNDAVDEGGPFFQSLGSNGRACVTCHQPGDGWTVTPVHLRERFEADDRDPVFRPVDGAVCSSADLSTHAARRKAYRLLLAKGLIRVSLPVPVGAEFRVDAIDDPYGCATPDQLSLYRRPLPATNLRFLTRVMWDGRESPAGRSLVDNLRDQALGAIMGHAQALVPPTSQQVDAIAAFEMGLFTAQPRDAAAGNLTAAGGRGGPEALAAQPFAVGINDPFEPDFDPDVFSVFSAWLPRTHDGDAPEVFGAGDHGVAGPAFDGGREAARNAVARGEILFNTFPIPISGVAGLNTPDRPIIAGTCSMCHDSPNAGSHSVPLPVDIGVASASRRTPDLPLYTLQCLATGELIQTTDPGRAMVTGRCADIGKMKGPVLRGLAARAPYFHNGSAATLMDAVTFYDARFGLHLTDRQKSDLVAFLRTL